MRKTATLAKLSLFFGAGIIPSLAFGCLCAFVEECVSGQKEIISWKFAPDWPTILTYISLLLFLVSLAVTVVAFFKVPRKLGPSFLALAVASLFMGLSVRTSFLRFKKEMSSSCFCPRPTLIETTERCIPMER